MRKFLSLLHSDFAFWSCLLFLQIALCFLLYFLFDFTLVFYWLGPLLLYDLIAFAYPYWLVGLAAPPTIQTTTSLHLQKRLNEYAHTHNLSPTELRITSTPLKTPLVLQQQNKLFIWSSNALLESLSEAEWLLLFDVIHDLKTQHKIKWATRQAGLFWWQSNPSFELLKDHQFSALSRTRRISWWRLSVSLLHKLHQESAITTPHSLLNRSYHQLLPELTSATKGEYLNVYENYRNQWLRELGTTAKECP